jgi:outer membrane protein assembly factor BamB
VRPSGWVEALPANQTASAGQAVAYQINPAHSGSIELDGFFPPLVKRWAIDLGGPVSYPLIAQAKVFVTVTDASGGGTKLHALDAATGKPAWGPIGVGGTYYGWANAAYDGGRIFVVNFDGLLKAFDAPTGILQWSHQLPGQYAFSSPPTAFQGIVYVGGAGHGGTLYAVDSATGDLLWIGGVANGDHSSPALSEDGVHLSYACAATFTFNRASGLRLWSYVPNCTGGGGRTPVYYRGRLYVRDWINSLPGHVLDSKTGELLSRYEVGPAAAFAGDLGFFLNAGKLEARDLTAQDIRWSFMGDGTLGSSPIVVNNHVYVGSTSGNVYALERSSGQQAWSSNVGAGIEPPNEHAIGWPLTGLGAGEGLLVVPAGHLLVAYSRE